jgi:carotenoid cleavage dioxygenase
VRLRDGHWFDGYGMVQAYRFTGEAVTHPACMVETQRYQQERQVNRQLYDSFGTHMADGIGFTAPDDINSSNINPDPTLSITAGDPKRAGASC